jgi:FkbM family methyltransferase
MSLSVFEKIQAWDHARRAYSRDRRNAKHEPETRFIAQLLASNDICLHVGASEGRHARVMAQAAPQGQVICLEPNAYSFAALRHFIRMHGLTNVEAIRAAVSDQPGEVTLNVPIKDRGKPGRSFGVIGDTASRSEVKAHSVRKERVPAITIDQFLAERGHNADFIRMDIEGAEILALRGARDLIARRKPNMLLEIHSTSLAENFGSSAEEVVGMLLSAGYRMFGLEDDRLVETARYDTDRPWKDFFFVHAFRKDRLPQGVFRDLMG